MTTRLRSCIAAALALLLLTGCCTDLVSTPAPSPSASTPAAATSPSATPPTLYDIKFPNTHRQLLAALPTKYGKHQLNLYSELAGGDGSPREDPLAGHQVEPEACRLAVWAGGQLGNTYAKWPYLPTALAHPADTDVSLSVNLVSLPLAWGEKYIALHPLAAPQCTRIRIDGTESAFIVERPIPGLGVRSRYVLRTYSLRGVVHREAYVSFATATYAVKIGSSSPTFNEPDLIAFARQVQVLADSKLR
ncbi:hypothetical protein AB0P21_23995 [Kribbella sp. NPDC056861]|uniref:hypothetical protein n=1 Tax=Kribbella sp. NPDC056861 TaxID=3154857 RepID=UPI0034208817